jgi:hypothetical protein
MLSLYPIHSECAVGINAESPEWHELDNHIMKFGDKRVFAGDYSKYDLRMPAQLILAAFRLLIEIAAECGYTATEQRIMRGYATEIAYAYTAYNGDLIKFSGSNPSGHNLTVYVNSIVNSLLVRCGFYSMYPRAEFDRWVAISTYGDDVKGTVHRRYAGFNHVSYAAFLADNDMMFTMPDKNADPTPFMDGEDCDFLKRKTFYNPDLKCKIGILDDDSIFKSLHCNLKSKVCTKQQVAAQNIDGAIRAWAYHGREIFNTRKAQMRLVAYKAGIDHICKFLEADYDVFVSTWKEKYRGSASGRP